jgi:hypothetical protein
MKRDEINDLSDLEGSGGLDNTTTQFNNSGVPGMGHDGLPKDFVLKMPGHLRNPSKVSYQSQDDANNAQTAHDSLSADI